MSPALFESTSIVASASWCRVSCTASTSAKGLKLEQMLRSRTGESTSFDGEDFHLLLRIMMLHLLCRAVGKLEARHAP